MTMFRVAMSAQKLSTTNLTVHRLCRSGCPEGCVGRGRERSLATKSCVADGEGNVSARVDGFYPGIDAPGSNTGPPYDSRDVHGVHASGRVEITTCSDAGAAGRNVPGQHTVRPTSAEASSTNCRWVTLQDQDVDSVGYGEPVRSSGYPDSTPFGAYTPTGWQSDQPHENLRDDRGHDRDHR